MRKRRLVIIPIAAAALGGALFLLLRESPEYGFWGGSDLYLTREDQILEVKCNTPTKVKLSGKGTGELTIEFRIPNDKPNLKFSDGGWFYKKSTTGDKLEDGESISLSFSGRGNQTSRMEAVLVDSEGMASDTVSWNLNVRCND